MSPTNYDAAWMRREAIRRHLRGRGILTVPSLAKLDNIAREHAAAARLGMEGHDDLCERALLRLCYCPERADALARADAAARRAGLDDAPDSP